MPPEVVKAIKKVGQWKAGAFASLQAPRDPGAGTAGSTLSGS
jgi:hypothetical protein